MLIDVLTMNLWGLPWPISRHRRARKQRFADHVADRPYDIVGIQELWWPWRRSFALEPLLLPRSGRDSGLALAGRMASGDEPTVRHFRAGNGIERLKRKGVLSARVRAEKTDAALAVHVTHLQAGPRAGHVRARQVDELLDVVASERGPAIVMGDFNFHAEDDDDQRSCERLTGAGFEDAAPTEPDASATYSSSNPYVRRKRCHERFDRVFLRGGSGVTLLARAVRVLSDVAAPFSDHHPLHVRVQVSG
jgi:endonuclease/exonuclease/phosphatase family metal-dependent hydrolase